MIRSAMRWMTASALALSAAHAAAQLYEGARLIPGDGGPAIESSAFLVAGKRADFLVLDGNPLDDIRNTRRISRMFVNGAEIDRAALKAGLIK